MANVNANVNAKMKCPVCDTEFEQTEFFMHTQEEILKQLMELNIRMNDMQEIMELTYTYMNDTDEDVDVGTGIEKPDPLSAEYAENIISADAACNTCAEDEDTQVISSDRMIMTEEMKAKASFLLGDTIPIVTSVKQKEEKKPLIPDSEFLSMMESIKRTNK
jgi:hypothetical protein